MYASLYVLFMCELWVCVWVCVIYGMYLLNAFLPAHLIVYNKFD